MLPSRGLLRCGTLAATATRLASLPSISVTHPSRAGTKARTSRWRKRHHSSAVLSADEPEARAGQNVTASNSPTPGASAVADGDKDVDEVERLLAVTATHNTTSTIPPPSSLPSVQRTTTATSGTAVDPGSVLHLKALHQAEEGTRSIHGPTHLHLEQIDRRRSKPSLSESEFAVGMTERLLPELPRLAALHEVHYGDAVVREIDRSTYFIAKQGNATEATRSSMEGTAASHPSTDSSAAPGEDASGVVKSDKPRKEVRLEEDLCEETFAAFDAEAGEVTASRPSAPLVSAAAVVSSKDDVSGGDAPPPDLNHQEGDDEYEEDLALSIDFATERPWFVPATGVVQLQPLPSQDCALLLRFMLHLRQQTEADLVPSLRRALIAAEQQPTWSVSEAKSSVPGRTEMPSRSAATAPGTGSRDRSSSLTLAEVVQYLQTAPPPVIAFTESLPPNRASPCTPVSAPDSTSPAFLFRLYLENISSQNALGHISALFGIPQRCFQSHTAVSKMSCSTVLCAVAENRVRREHLLLLNTLRHPGFVLRVSNILEVPQDLPGAGGTDASSSSLSSPSQRLFGELARWQPLYHTEILLRRVCSAGSTSSGSGLSTRQQIEHRLRALQTVGAICFCANREASLARAATDVLHGFFRSALLNALQRPKPPVPLTRFLKRPNLATAKEAHHVSTDATVRQTLKAFMQCNGDWHATVARTPYVWRRRWINALRGLVWNTMASQRLRKAGREVCIGDVVLKRKYRDDVHRRGIINVKAEHVMVVKTSAEAQAASMEDILIPFLRGRYPEHLFADESTGHPIMTKSGMLALLRDMHAPQLLLGFTDEMRLLLDVRADVSPLLFRRLLVRPLELQFAIMEDKPPMRALHFDAARLLSNDRWMAAEADLESRRRRRRQQQQQEQEQNPSSDKGVDRGEHRSSDNAPPPAGLQPSCTSHLIPPSEVLARTTLGARLASGLLSEQFFSIPSADDYVVLGHAHRHLSGDLVPAAPLSDTAAVGDRVYSVYIRAVVDHNLAGLSNMLRECFALSGIETEADSALQHKVHRMRRELDPETMMLTTPVYCSTCYSRDHDTQDQCAEYQYKRHRQGAQLDVAAAALDAAAAAAKARMGEAVPLKGDPTAPSAEVQGNRHHGVALDEASVVTTQTGRQARRVCMRWRLRRRHDEQRWGVHFTKALHLVGIEHVSLLREAVVWCSATSQSGDAAATAMPDEDEACSWPSSWMIPRNAGGDKSTPLSSSSPPGPRIVQFLRAALGVSDDNAAPQQLDALSALVEQSPLVRLPPAASAVGLPPSTGTAVPSELKVCKWRLVQVNTKPVCTQGDVAAALLTEASKSREVWLTFEIPISATASDSVLDVSVHPKRGVCDPAGADATHGNVAPTALQATGLRKASPLTPPQQRRENEVMQSFLSNVSPEAQQWMHDLPFRVTIVLQKRRRDHQAHRSWGLQLDGADMTLVNFSKLVTKFMTGVHARDEQQQQQGGGTGVSVAAIAPGEAFPRLSDRDNRVASQKPPLLGDDRSSLELHLNHVYRLVRIHNTSVHHKAEAMRVMADFQASLDAQRTPMDVVGECQGPPQDSEDCGTHTHASATSKYFLLTLTLERKASSYRACSPGTAPSADSTPLSAEKPPENAAGALVVVDPAFLTFLSTERCPVRPMTAAQLSRSVVTIAINRLLLTSATRDKWGLRLQRNTRRIKSIQENRNFTFHVFAQKKSQGTRIADTLRLVPPPSPAAAAVVARNAEDGKGASIPATKTRAHHLYYVEKVNRNVVRAHAEMRRALHSAAQPQQQQEGGGLAPMSALPPESVTLSVRQFPLLRLSATVRRGGVGEESALGPVGLQVDKRMQVVAVFSGSPMARALEEAAGPGCSVRRLIRSRDIANGAMGNTPGAASEAVWDVVETVPLRHSLSRVVAAMYLLESSPGSSAGVGHAGMPPPRKWDYDMDEDTQDGDGDGGGGGGGDPKTSVGTNAALSPSKSADPEPAPVTPLPEDVSDVCATLQDLAATAVHVQQQLGKLSMVDGVHLLQASILEEFALEQLSNLSHHHQHRSTPSDTTSAKDVVDPSPLPAAARHDLRELRDRLTAVHDEVRWEVVYAVESNRPLRTPADLAAAFAPGVGEETIILQQLIED